MKKLSPPIIAGVLFVVLFLVVVYVFQAFGVWNPPGVAEGEGGHEDENYAEETLDPKGESTLELHGYNNVYTFATENGFDVECVAKKLDRTPEELDVEARSIHRELDIEIDEILELMLECPRTESEKSLEPDNDGDESIPASEGHKEPTDKGTIDATFDSSKILGSDNIMIIVNQYGIPEDCLAEKLGVTADQLDIRGKDLKKQLGVDMDYIREKMDECLGIPHINPHEEDETNSTEPVNEEIVTEEPLPVLEGSDNLLEYLISIDAPPDCVAQFLGLKDRELNAEAKDIKESLGIDMDTIRDIVANCIEITKNLDINKTPTIMER